MGGAAFARVQVDDLGIDGSTTDVIDYGNLITDKPIHTNFLWALQGTSDWTYRVLAQNTYYGSGGVPVTGDRQIAYSYDSFARMTDVKGVLKGTIELPGPVGNSRAAPRPSEQSKDGIILLKHVDYDSNGFGLIARVTGPNEQCTQIAYDNLYSQLPNSSTTFTGGCGVHGLVTTTTFDRGFEAPLTEIDAAGALTTFDYDTFGRVTTVFQSASTAGMTAPAAALKVDYVDEVPIRRVHFSTVDGTSANPIYREHYRYFDSFGDTVAALDEAGDATKGPVWTVSGAHVSAEGQIISLYKPLTMTGTDPSNANLVAQYANQGPKLSFAYDELGRPTKVTDFNGGVSTRTYTFPSSSLGVTLVDPDQQKGGAHFGSFSTLRLDGHGQVVERGAHLVNTSYGTSDYSITAQYQATGEPTVITQSNGSNASAITRWMTYDSLGRRVFNAEPNTSANFSATPGSSGVRGWTYAYSDSGLLVGTSDARGCGENLFHDGAGRTVAEDYSPCEASQLAYTPANLGTGDGAEVFNVYDVTSPGRLGRQYDRALASSYFYDARGEVTTIKRQLATPYPTPLISQRYSPHIFGKKAEYSEAHQLVAETSGADVTELLGTKGQPALAVLDTSYTRDGLVQTTTGSYGTLLKNQAYDAAGAVTEQVLGDVAATTSVLKHYVDETLHTYSVNRSAGPWLAPSASYTPPAAGDPTLVGTLTGVTLQYEKSGSVSSMVDSSAASQWPAGLKPASRSFSYFDDYRLNDSSTNYGGGDDPFNFPPYAPEAAEGSTSFPPIQSPPSIPNRVRDQSYLYSWSGDLTGSNDDAQDFPDREAGHVSKLGSPTAGPNQLVYSYFFNPPGTDTPGEVAPLYDAAGNVTEIDIKQNGAPAWSYQYTWDELGRMSGATRLDGGGNLLAQEQCEYDASGARARHMKYDFDLGTPFFDVTVFGSLKLIRSEFDAAMDGNYETDAQTEQLYVNAGGTSAHVYFSGGGLPGDGTAGSTHVALALGDATASTGFVIDRDTSELMERPTYLAYGADESDFRPERWNFFRENYRYTGHQDDAEVGLIYFGARFYSPQLGRWMSADPLTIHGLGSDPNPYAFVSGSPIGNTDPFGLDNCGDNIYCGDPTAIVPAVIPFDPTQVNWSQVGKDFQSAGNWWNHNIAPFFNCLFGDCGGPPPPTLINNAVSAIGSTTWSDPFGNSRWNPNAQSPYEAMVLGSSWPNSGAGVTALVGQLSPLGGLYNFLDAGRSPAARAVGLLQFGASVVPFLAPGVRAVEAAAEVVEAAGTVARAAEDIPATFIGQESGPSIVVPQGATGPSPTWNGTGVQYTGGAGGPGLNIRVSGVRIMEPTLPNGPSPGYPGGYASYFNASGQTVKPAKRTNNRPVQPVVAYCLALVTQWRFVHEARDRRSRRSHGAGVDRR